MLVVPGQERVGERPQNGSFQVGPLELLATSPNNLPALFGEAHHAVPGLLDVPVPELNNLASLGSQKLFLGLDLRSQELIFNFIRQYCF